MLSNSGMANSVVPDQTAPSGAVWSGSALFVYGILSETLMFQIFGHLPLVYDEEWCKVSLNICLGAV